MSAIPNGRNGERRIAAAGAAVDDVIPDLVQQLLDADDLSGVPSETDQEAHRPEFELYRCPTRANLVKRRIDAQRTDPKD